MLFLFFIFCIGSKTDTLNSRRLAVHSAPAAVEQDEQQGDAGLVMVLQLIDINRQCHSCLLFQTEHNVLFSSELQFILEPSIYK